ncbi:rubrerythrin [Methanocaldococcus infernus]|uniref:Rubrerythrin n=1 Tax=Methanocaldococcus infernus (strain DSM 11812 / JCM 15783 / ME) TaxID=573063 RepID=D5VSJ3_METIM|nr:rubrerythrin family protein [Methanocaldococcus infernus]ADG13546.1 Rubrerythrin [Methanocaldococcus infernus ME]
MKETLINLAKAYVGESMARNRYTCFAKIAKQEGYEKIAEIFLLTAENEREHAKWLYYLATELKKKYNIDEPIKIEVEVPIVLGDTKENLKAAIEGESYEYESMYPEFAEIAEKEGLKEIADRLRAIAIAEKHHKERYEAILKALEEGKIYKKDEEVEWVCMKCGYVHKANEPPEECPSCSHPRKYFELRCEKF